MLVFSHAINNNKNKYKTILLGYWYLMYTDFDTEISQNSHVWSVLGLNAANVCVLDRDRSKPIKFLSGRLMETCHCAGLGVSTSLLRYRECINLQG